MRICTVTGTRAEYGLLKPLIKRLVSEEEIDHRLIATGSHLSVDYGYTIDEILSDGMLVDEMIPILSDEEGVLATAKSMSRGLVGFTDYFQRMSVDVVVLLGDRYETFVAAIAAMNSLIPIVHIHGGETTEGAMDEVMRHAITKMSYLHFVSTETYRLRVIQMGEAPDRVYNVGALGVENIREIKLPDKGILKQSLPFQMKEPYALVTYHPETMGGLETREQIDRLLEACKTFEDVFFVFTKANADTGGQEINRRIQSYTENHKNGVLVDSLGLVRYLGLMRDATMVLGNSSSGIIEAPCFGVPTVNVGDRQKGRVRADSVLDCPLEKEAMIEVMSRVMKKGRYSEPTSIKNPYEGVNTSHVMANVILETFRGERIIPTKKFYDIEVAK